MAGGVELYLTVEVSGWWLGVLGCVRELLTVSLYQSSILARSLTEDCCRRLCICDRLMVISCCIGDMYLSTSMMFICSTSPSSYLISYRVTLSLVIWSEIIPLCVSVENSLVIVLTTSCCCCGELTPLPRVYIVVQEDLC